MLVSDVQSVSVPYGITISIFVAIAVASVTYAAGLAVYRVWFSPLSKVPGPWLAGATSWYEAYYELVPNGGGMFTKKIKELHGRYGETHVASLELLQL